MASENAVDTKQDFSVVNSLFGLDPDALARSREQMAQAQARADAERRAQLAPGQLMGATMMEGASNLGRAVAPAVQGMFGMTPPVDPQMKFAQTMKGIMGELQQSGVDMSDPIAAQAEVGKRLVQRGFPQQGMAALENVRLLQQQQAIAQADAQKKQAETMKAYAEAAKAVTDKDPAAQAFATGKVTPESYGAYLKSKDVGDLVLADPEKYTKVDTADGVFMVNKRDPQDKYRLGDIPASLKGDTKAASKASFQEGLDKYGLNSPEAWDKLKQDNPGAYASMVAAGRDAFGAENVRGVIPNLSGGDVTEWEMKNARFALRGQSNLDRFVNTWGGKQIPANANVKGLLSYLNQVDPNVPVGIKALNGVLGDSDFGHYLADAIQVRYPGLRLDTGAAISAQEWLTEIHSSIPMPTDDAATVKKKLDKMKMDQAQSVALAYMTPHGADFLKRQGVAKPAPYNAAGAPAGTSAARPATADDMLKTFSTVRDDPTAYKKWFDALAPDEKKWFRAWVSEQSKGQ